jgi:transcriptional regulator with XRE-family HTH domain
MGAFENLGQALRWLRNRQHRKQYEIAEAAGITKAMLSAYETGKQNPSIETLEKILHALGADLSGLHHALVLHQDGAPPDAGAAGGGWYEPEQERYREPALRRTDVYHTLAIDRPLTPDQERSLGLMLEGFHGLLRHMVRHLETSPRAPSAPPAPWPGRRGAGEPPEPPGADEEE